MTEIYLSHSKYLARYGLARWLLRECIRANPFYVVSAALLSYGVLKLNTEIDPQIGKLRGIVLGLVLLNVYELALLAVATVVLKHRRAEGGRDLHGLALVAALFLGGSLLALDELIAMYPALGFVLMPSALALAYAKLAWYARLPGVNLPARYRRVAILILAAHAISPLLGLPELKREISLPAVQGLAWLCGWLALVPVIWLIWRECWPRPNAASAPQKNADDSIPDLLQTRWCGAWTVFIATVLGVLHLAGSDWVFDRPYDAARLLPALTILVACLVVLRWGRGVRLDFLNTLLVAAPFAAAYWAWTSRPPGPMDITLQWLVALPCQTAAAGLIMFAALSWLTRRWEFLAALLSPLWAPLLVWSWRMRSHALFSAGAGFVVLILGMLMSLYRQRLLGWLDPAPQSKPAAEAPVDGGTTSPSLTA